MTHPTVAALYRHLLLYRRLWRASVFSFLVTPFLLLVSLGLGVGHYVGTVDGVSYLAWIAPALLVSTAFQIGVTESTYGVLSDFEWVGGLRAMRVTMVRIKDMIGGWLLYTLVVVTLATVAFMIVMWAFGILPGSLVPVAPLVSGLVAVAAAAPTVAFSASITNEDYFILLSRFLVLPAALFSGVYFPVDNLPVVIRPLAYLSPLWHGVELIRAAAWRNDAAWPPTVHIGYLALFAVVGFLVAHRVFHRRLTG